MKQRLERPARGPEPCLPSGKAGSNFGACQGCGWEMQFPRTTTESLGAVVQGVDPQEERPII